MVMRHKKTACFLSDHTLVDKSKGPGKDTEVWHGRSTRKIYIEIFFLVIMILKQKLVGLLLNIYVSLPYSCKTEGENGISRLISTVCINCKFTSEHYSGIFQNY